MDKNLLIEIFVPTPHGGGYIGTGYPIWKDRILTARHVLFPSERTESCGPILVRWHHMKNTAAHAWQAIRKVVWDGGEDFDVAVIDCAFSKEANGWGYPSAAKPRDDMPWRSEGFSRVGAKDDHSRQAIPMQGRVYSMADAEPMFHLGVDDPHHMPEGWRGASGCPVFFAGAIIGVVSSCPENFAAGRLAATPMWKLLENEEFCRASGCDIRRDQVRHFKKSVIDILNDAPAAMAVLEDTPNTAASNETRAQQLAEALLQLDHDRLFEKAREARQSLLARGQGADAKIIKKLAFMVLPAVFDPGVLGSVRGRGADPALAVMALPIATPTVAELVMAGVDRRPLNFQAMTRPRELPRGEFALPPPPEAGRESAKPHKVAWTTYLTDKFAPEVKQQSGRFDPDAVIQYAADELALEAESGTTWYHLVELPRDDSERRRFVADFQELKQKYPALVFVELSSDSELLRREHPLVYWLRLLLTEDEP